MSYQPQAEGSHATETSAVETTPAHLFTRQLDSAMLSVPHPTRRSSFFGDDETKSALAGQHGGRLRGTTPKTGGRDKWTLTYLPHSTLAPLPESVRVPTAHPSFSNWMLEKSHQHMAIRLLFPPVEEEEEEGGRRAG